MVLEKIIKFLIAVVVVLFATFFVRDWYVFIQCGAVRSCLVDASSYQHVTKFLVPIIAALISFIIGRNSLCKRDRRLLQASFLMIILADFCFKILHNYTLPLENRSDYISIGIIFFMLAQSLLIVRHTRTSDTDASFPWIFCIPIAVTFALGVLMLAHIYDSLLFFAAVSYGPFLFCSLYAACKTPKRGYFPKENALQIKWGMILFTFCDLLTGLSLWSGEDLSLHENLSIVANNLIWCFYTPALILLALSGYRHRD